MGSWESYVDLKDREKTEKEFSKANKLGFSLGGYVEIKYKADAPEGESKYEVTGSITGKLKFTYSEGTTVQVWIIPVRVDVSISVSGELTFTVKFDPDTLQFEVPETLILSLRAELRRMRASDASLHRQAYTEALLP